MLPSCASMVSDSAAGLCLAGRMSASILMLQRQVMQVFFAVVTCICLVA
jgi:hypothetical protein